MWHTPILLRLADFPLPSDLEGLERRDFTEDQAHGKADASELIAWLAQRMANTPSKANLPTPKYLPKTTSSDGQVRTYNRFNTISPSEWSNMLWDAEREIIFAAPKLYKLWRFPWTDRPSSDSAVSIDQVEISFERLLTEKIIADRVNVTAIMPDPNSIDDAYLKRPVDSESFDEFLSDLSKARRRWYTLRQGIENRLAAQGDGPEVAGRIEIITLWNMRFPNRLTMTEKRMFLTLRFYQERFNTRFSIDAAPSSGVSDEDTPIFHLMRRDIELILEENRKRSEEDYREWKMVSMSGSSMK